MEGLTFPAGKLCRIRKVLASDLYYVTIEKMEAGPVHVVAEPDNDELTDEQKVSASVRLETTEELFVSMLEEDMIGNEDVGLGDILSHFVKSLVLDRETMVMSAVKIDVEAEKKKILEAKEEAERIVQQKDKQDQEIRDQKARKRAERAAAKLENTRLAKEHLQERVVYARKLMQLEVKRLAALKKAREEREQRQSEPVQPTLALPEGKLLRVRRVINSEVASLELAKVQVDGDWKVLFTSEGLDSGVVHTLTTTEKELTSMLQENDFTKDTGDLLRLFSKMVAFDQTDDNPGLRLHAVDEAAEKERIRQWRDQAMQVAGATTTVTSTPESAPTPEVAQGNNSDRKKSEKSETPMPEVSLQSLKDVLAGERTGEGDLFQKSKNIGGKSYNITMRLSGHKLFVTSKSKEAAGTNIEYTCSLEHALMLLPSEQQLWDTEVDLFTSLISCVQVGKGGRSLTLRRKTSAAAKRRRREMGELAGTKAFEGVKQQQDDEERQRQEIETNHRRERAIYRRQQGGAGANKKGRMNSELQRKIEEHYHSMSNEADQNQRKQKSNKIKLKSLNQKSASSVTADDDDDENETEDSEEVLDRLRSLERAHQFLLPASRGNVLAAAGLSGTLPPVSESKKLNDGPQNCGGFGRYDSSVLTQETLLEQSSIVSVQGSIAARVRLQDRLAAGYFGEDRRGPDVDPLFPLEARSKGSFFLKRALRDAFGPVTSTQTVVVPAPILSGSRSMSKASMIREVESKMISAGGGLLFQIAAQHNSWGSPEHGRGPGFRSYNKTQQVRRRRKKK